MAPTLTRQASRNDAKTPEMLKIEAWLDAHGAEWEYDPALPLSSIDTAASHRNQARVVPLLEDVVVRYAADLEQGDHFPPTVVYRTKGGSSWITIDGNQRHAALDLNGERTTAAYKLVAPPARQLETLVRSANKEHGTPNTDEERLIAAAFLVEKHQMKAIDAARQTGVSARKLTDYLHRRETERRMASQGVRGWEQLSVNARSRLGAVRSDVVLKAAAQLAVDAEMAGHDVDGLVTALNKLRTEDGQLSAVRMERDKRVVEIKERGGVRMPLPLRQLGQGVGMLNKIDQEALRALDLSDDYRAVLKERLDEGLGVLNALRRIAR